MMVRCTVPRGICVKALSVTPTRKSNWATSLHGQAWPAQMSRTPAQSGRIARRSPSHRVNTLSGPARFKRYARCIQCVPSLVITRCAQTSLAFTTWSQGNIKIDGIMPPVFPEPPDPYVPPRNRDSSPFTTCMYWAGGEQSSSKAVRAALAASARNGDMAT